MEQTANVQVWLLPGAACLNCPGFESVLAYWRISFLCDKAAALRDSPAWVFGLMLQWEDERTRLCRGRLSLLRTCVRLPQLQVPEFRHISSNLVCSYVHLSMDLFGQAHSFSRRLSLSYRSLCLSKWISSYIISMPLAPSIDSRFPSSPTPLADTEFLGDPWTLSPSVFQFPP